MVGSIQPQQSMDVSQSWIPTQKGNYKIETFVWDSIADPTPRKKPNVQVYHFIDSDSLVEKIF